MKKTSTVFFLGIFMSLVACNEQYPDMGDGLYAEFVTNKGTFVAELYYEQTPLTVANFVTLAEGTNPMVDSTYKGEKFFDSLIFHRVIEDFMIQGGDPEGTGMGGPGYKFADEFVDSLNFGSKGILAMANSGPNTNGSQFFITLKETPHLNQRHTIFGNIVKGMEVVDSIGVTETTGRTSQPFNKPLEDVIIERVNIIRKGNGAKNFNAVKVFTETMEKAEKEKAEALSKMEEAKKESIAKLAGLKSKAEELPSGLKIYFLKNADGQKPEIGNMVGVYYEGYLTDGTLFDSNREEVARKFGKFDERRAQGGGYSPIPMKYGPDARLIAGFKEGLMEMGVGDKTVLFIPSHLGYGERGRPGVIPPNSDLIFVLEITGIK